MLVISTASAQQYPPGAGGWVAAFNHVVPGFGLPPNPSAPAVPNATNPYAPFGTITFHSVQIGSQTLFAQFAQPFHAIHMSLIPKGPNRGKVLVWDDFPVVFQCSNFDPGNFWAYQAYAIVDPSVPSFQNFLLPIARVNLTQELGEDLFCSGHTWSNFGDLVVGSGTHFNPIGGQTSGRATFVFDPEQAVAPFTGQPPSSNGINFDQHLYPAPALGLWAVGPILVDGRYYPTLLLTHRLARTNNRETIPVFGGGIIPPGSPPGTIPATWNTYEGLVIDLPPFVDLALNAVRSGLLLDNFSASIPLPPWAGPGNPLGPPNLDWLEVYPRAMQMTNGRIFVSGYPHLSGHLDHETTLWNQGGNIGHVQPPFGWNDVRFDGASVRYPNIDGSANTSIRLGGYAEQPPGSEKLTSTNTVEVCIADQPGAPWKSLPDMNHRRCWLNVVLTPDASMIAFGGASMIVVENDPPHYPGANPVMTPEIFSPGDTAWVDMTWAPAASVRDYHSTALLLDDGRILVAGGNHRSVDYEIFEPPYLPASSMTIGIAGQTPAGNAPFVIGYADTMAHFTVESSPLPFGTTLEKAVLMAPGSTTHHSDMNQRYHQLVATSTPDGLKCTPPANDVELQRGYYMLFVFTNTGKISHSIWVRLQ